LYQNDGEALDSIADMRVVSDKRDSMTGMLYAIHELRLYT
jgi:hypothetical protein